MEVNKEIARHGEIHMNEMKNLFYFELNNIQYNYLIFKFN